MRLRIRRYIIHVPRDPQRLNAIIGQNIKNERLRRGWTQRQLGQILGYSQHYMSQLEGGARSIKAYHVAQIAHAVERPVEVFFADTHPRPYQSSKKRV